VLFDIPNEGGKATTPVVIKKYCSGQFSKQIVKMSLLAFFWQSLFAYNKEGSK